MPSVSPSEPVNRLKKHPIVVLDLAELILPLSAVARVDVAPLLENKLLLREARLRDFVRSHDWTQYAETHVAIFCSEEVILPPWAYPLLAVQAYPHALSVHRALPEEVEKQLLMGKLAQHDWTQYADKIVMLKGCGSLPFAELAYTQATLHLLPHVRTLTYGEPCGAIPLFKKKKQHKQPTQPNA